MITKYAIISDVGNIHKYNKTYDSEFDVRVAWNRWENTEMVFMEDFVICEVTFDNNMNINCIRILE